MRSIYQKPRNRKYSILRIILRINWRKVANYCREPLPRIATYDRIFRMTNGNGDPKNPNRTKKSAFGERSNLDEILYRAVPSQIPMHVTRVSYKRMLTHCMTQDVKMCDLWACRKTGAKILARVVRAHIYETATGHLKEITPVATLYCSACDPVPQTHSGDSIYDYQVMTVAM